MEAAVRDFEYITAAAWETVEATASAGYSDQQVTSQVSLSRSTANNDVSSNGKVYGGGMIKQPFSGIHPSIIGVGSIKGTNGNNVIGGGSGEEKHSQFPPQFPSQPSQRKLVSPLQSLLNTDKQRRKHAKSRLFKPESNRDQQLRGLNRSLAKGNVVLSHEGFAPVRLLKFTPRCALGLPVATMFGSGIVTRFRPSDGIYEVLIQWDTTGRQSPIKAYLTATALLSTPSTPNPLVPSLTKPSTKASTTLSSTILSSTAASSVSITKIPTTSSSSHTTVTLPSIVNKVKPSSLPKEKVERVSALASLPAFRTIGYCQPPPLNY